MKVPVPPLRIVTTGKAKEIGMRDGEKHMQKKGALLFLSLRLTGNISTLQFSFNNN